MSDVELRLYSFAAGLIITNRRTLWVTVGMFVRLLGIYALSQYFIWTSVLKKRMPERSPEATVTKPIGIFKFYRPLLLSSFIAVVGGPAINAMLGKTSHGETAIAAFAIAASLTNLVQSFFSYIHQIVLNFYRASPERVARFVLAMAFIPTVLIGLLSYTAAGPWLMIHVVGANERLMDESLHTLRVFMLMTLAFTWLDFGNGILMLRRQSRVMLVSQTANIAATVLMLIVLVALTPGWNGMVGALAQSLGTVAELTVVTIAVRRTLDDAAITEPGYYTLHNAQ